MAYRTTIWVVAALTLAIGLSEMAFGLREDSSVLIKDGAEWAYGTVIYAVAALTYGGSPRRQFAGSIVVALVLLLGGLQATYEVVSGLYAAPEGEEGSVRTIASSTSLLGSVLVAGLLARFRRSDDPLIEGAWFSARNDIVTSLVDMGVVLGLQLVPARWPQTASDVLGAALAFWAAHVVARDALAARRRARAAR